MDILYEQEIVRSFFAKNYQERIIYELNNKGKRKNVFSRLCHDFDKLLNYRYMEECRESDYLDIYKILQLHGAPNSCYVLSYNTMIDGKYIALNEALSIAVGYGMPSLIVCVPNQLAYFEAEQIQGAPPRYLLKRNI